MHRTKFRELFNEFVNIGTKQLQLILKAVLVTRIKFYLLSLVAPWK